MSVRFSTLSSFSFQAMKANKLRSFLTVLGIIIGVGAVIMMMALGQGTQNQIMGQINSMGSNLLTVMPGAGGQFVRGAGGGGNTLTLQDATAIAQLPGVEAVAPTVRTSGVATAGNKTWSTNITGATPDMEVSSSLKLEQGRFLSADDIQGMSAVAVLGQTAYQNLFAAGVDPVGSMIRVKGVTFRVVGLLQSQGATMGMDMDDVIYIPVTTAQVRLMGTVNQSVSTIQVTVASSDQMDSTQNAIESLLRRRHRLAATQDDDFNIRNMAQIQATAQSITGFLTIFLAAIAGISLLVGGIGVMNIMLVSVTERTREIGIRMAIGASRRAILSQFLMEAVMLSLTGSVFGILLGLIGSKIFSTLAGWPAPITITSVLLSVGFSICIGVFFGYYPARRAASLNPAEALSFE